MLIGENSYLLVDFSFFTFPLEKDEKMVFNITKTSQELRMLSRSLSVY